MKRLPGTCFAALSLLVLLFSCSRQPEPQVQPLRCAVCTEGSFSGLSLLPGYNREMLRRFAGDEGRETRIRLCRHAGRALDSLRSGSLDIVALPHRASLPTDSSLTWLSADSCGIWVFRASDSSTAEQAGNWFGKYAKNPNYAIIRQPFLDIYNPMTRVSADFISPYDSLLKAWADTLGWDWKLLAALIYQESRFRVEAVSPAGARGLMQLLPSTAERYGCTDTFDPEENIMAGVRLLQVLEERYKDISRDPAERRKFALAAYNAGVGRIGDCLSYASHIGTDISIWENVAAVIPDLQKDSVAALEAVRYGTFNGQETIAFVRQVGIFHKRYRHICP